MTYFAPSPEFSKCYKANEKFRETVKRNVKKLGDEEITFDQYLDSNDRALRQAKARLRSHNN